MHARNQRLQKLGERIARRTLRRARLYWKLRNLFRRDQLSFLDYLIKSSELKQGIQTGEDRICALVGARGLFSAFTLEEQAGAAQAALQRKLTPTTIGRHPTVIAGVIGISWSPGWISYWRVR